MRKQLACCFKHIRKNSQMKTFSVTTIGTYGVTGNGSTPSPHPSGNDSGNTSKGNTQIDSRKKNDPNKVDPTKQDERDNDPTRIRPEVNEPEKIDPTTPEPEKLPKPGGIENDKDEQPKKTIGFLREE